MIKHPKTIPKGEMGFPLLREPRTQEQAREALVDMTAAEYFIGQSLTQLNIAGHTLGGRNYLHLEAVAAIKQYRAALAKKLAQVRKLAGGTRDE